MSEHGALPTMAIVTPSLNQGRWIRTAIESVLGEGYPGLDYLVVDALSTDDSCSIACSYGPRVRLLSEADHGQSDAINKGFSLTQGEVIGWLNADDAYIPGTLKKVGEIFADDPDVSLVYGNAEFIGDDGRPLGSAVHVEPYSRRRMLSVGDLIIQPAAFFRRSFFDAVGGLRTDLHWTMDYDLWLRLGEAGRVVYLKDNLALVRCHLDAKTFSGGLRRLAEVESMLKEHGGQGLPAYFMLEAATYAVANARQALVQGDLLKAFRQLGTTAFRTATSASAMAALVRPRTWHVIRAARLRAARMGKPSNPEM